MCYIWKYPTHPSDEVSLATLEKIPSGIDNLNITGGEPTLRADLPEIVEILRPKARILEISSNGLHANRLEPIIRKYPDIKVRFSLEGFEQTNNKIRGETDGFQTKVKGLQRLKELGGTDLGFGAVIQDDNVEELLELYRFCRRKDVEFSTSALHNAFQFHKNDNAPYDRLRVAKKIEGLIVEMLKTQSVKNWFRAYLNLGLIEKVLGHDRLISCTAGTDFLFVDPWSDVYACNVRPDLLMGNLQKQTWDDVFAGQKSNEIRTKVHSCTQNCWMVTTARTAMRHPRLPFLPKQKPLSWVITNKIRVSLGLPILFERYVDYKRVSGSEGIRRESYLGAAATKRSLQRSTDVHYVQIGEFYNR
jgi:Fe-coproporphyrin III synthase